MDCEAGASVVFEVGDRKLTLVRLTAFQLDVHLAYERQQEGKKTDSAVLRWTAQNMHGLWQLDKSSGSEAAADQLLDLMGRTPVSKNPGASPS